MKLLLAIIQPTKLQAVREALLRVGVQRMTVHDAQGYGRQLGQTATYRGIEYEARMLRKLSLEICVNDDFVEKTIDVIQSVARTGTAGNIGDGKIFVLPLEEAVAIPTATRGPGAV